MQRLIYTADIDEEICDIDRLHLELDVTVEDCMKSNDLAIKVVRSTLESPDECTEHDYREGVYENE